MSHRKLRGRTLIVSTKQEYQYLLQARRVLVRRLESKQLEPEMQLKLKLELEQLELNLLDITYALEVGKAAAGTMDTSLDIADSTGVAPEPCPEQKPTLHGLSRFADWFGLDTRKAIKALAGDYDVEIRRLRQEGRPGVARWNSVLAWGFAVMLVLKSPISWVVSRALNAFRGSGA